MAEYISLGASALEILKILVSVFRRLDKKKEADATEKAIKEIESEKKTTEAEARAVTQKVLREELNEEEAKEVLDVISTLEGLFPIHPKGEVLEYGLALNDLISESVVALKKIKAFKILGIRLPKAHHGLEMRTFTSRLFEIVREQSLRRKELEGNSWRGYMLSGWLAGHPYLRFVPFILYNLVFPAEAYLSFKANYPYSFFIVYKQRQGEYEETEVRLDYLKLKLLREGLMYDIRQYVENISKEYEASQLEAKKIEDALAALRQLSATA